MLATPCRAVVLWLSEPAARSTSRWASCIACCSIARRSPRSEPTKGNQRHFQGVPPERLVVLGLFNPSSDGLDDPRLARIRDRWKRQLQGRRCRVEALA